ncbi:PEP-utilizing enzyme [Lachnospiraceae bacterium 54-53]
MKNNGRNKDEIYTGNTCYPGKKSEFDVWTRGNVAEAFPDIMTPLSWSLWGETMNELLRNAFRHYSFSSEVKEKCFIMLKNGRLYYNIGLVNLYMKRIGLFAMDTIIGGETAYTNRRSKGKIHWIRFLVHLPGSIKSEKNNEQLEAKSKLKWREFLRYHKKWADIDYQTYDMNQLFRILNERIAYGKENMHLHTDATTAAFSKMALLQWKLNKYGYDNSALLKLVNDIEGIEMAEIRKYMERLKHIIMQSEKKQQILECLKSENWKQSLTDSGFGEVQTFINDQLIEKYGHRGKNELEIKEPYWAENPRMLLHMIVERCENKEAGRLREQEKVSVDDKKFGKLIAQARMFTKLRENNKHYLYYIIMEIKRIIRILNMKLCIVIPEMENDDIYFMEYDELSRLIRDSADFAEIKTKVLQRKQIYSDYMKNSKEPVSPKSLKKVLRGIPACYGRVKGNVKVIDCDNAGEIKKGDIIVMKSLDISWTPLFSVAGGLITELGGILSHAAIIAREYNIPTIVNVENATATLEDGDRVVLDGETGVIYYDKAVPT